MKHRWKILLVLVFGCLLGLVLLMPRGGYRRAVEAYKQELRAKGERLTVPELAPPHSTNPPTAAMRFFVSSNFPVFINPPAAMVMISPGVAAAGYKNMPAPSAASYQSNVSRMAEMREVLKSSSLDFNLDYSHLVAMPLPHLSVLKNAERTATTTFLQALAQNDDTEARADLSAAVDLVRLHDNEPIILSYLVRAVNANTAFGATWEALASEAFSEPQLGELQAKWADMDLFKSLESAFAMQRVVSMEALSRARNMEKWEDVVSAGLAMPRNATQPGPNDGMFSRLYISLYNSFGRYRFNTWKSSVSYDEELTMLQVLGAAGQAAHRIQETGDVTAARREYHSAVTNFDLQHARNTNSFLFATPGSSTSFENDVVNLARIETSRRLVVVAIALKRWQLRHGALPATLDELVPSVLPKVPIDLLDGKPLRYRLKPDGTFLLYSVGLDGEDNGGDPTPSGTTGSGSDFQYGRDIVWPRVATAAEAGTYYKAPSSAGSTAPK